ncbi:MAG TPA: flagellar hook-basal body complex protein FliE [Archaeoglobus profundus]|nr:flagellar hook-basal body complex protein FliE [Archaeoglobus profundus]
MRVIAFVGLPLSGKSTAAKVAEEMGIPVVCMGDIVREEAKKRGLALTDENLGKIANELRQKEGLDAIAKRCIPIIREKGKDVGVVVIDGIRGIAEVERFKREFGDDFILINIEAPLEVRFQRALKRGRSDDISSIEELKKRDERELSWNMGEAIKIANFTIENTSSLEDFKEKIRDILTQIARKVEILIETTVHPTEDVNKVIQAVKNIFPDAEVEIENGKLRAKAWDLSKFRDLLRKQRILDTARSELYRGVSGNEITIYLNKQTAVISKINFADEDAILSPLKVTFKLYGVSVGRFIDYVAPATRAGKPIKELDTLWG